MQVVHRYMDNIIIPSFKSNHNKVSWEYSPAGNIIIPSFKSNHNGKQAEQLPEKIGFNILKESRFAGKANHNHQHISDKQEMK